MFVRDRKMNLLILGKTKKNVTKHTHTLENADTIEKKKELFFFSIYNTLAEKKRMKSISVLSQDKKEHEIRRELVE